MADFIGEGLDNGNTHLSAVKSNDDRIYEIDIGAPDFIV
jgi:hypothetical protein